MKVLLSGGGTIGSVSPLVAVYERMKEAYPETEFLWLETRKGPEDKLIKSYNIPVKPIFSGKLRRYFSFKNFIDPIFIFIGFIQSFFIILKFKPDVILSAGGFVSVPIAWAGWLLRKPILIHQQDIRPGLANKLMDRFAKIVTVTFKKSLNDFEKNKVVLVGNPVRKDILSGTKEGGYKFFGFNADKPVVLITGGGTGALELNNIVIDSLQELVSFCQVIHLTGGKTDKEAEHNNYRSYNFLTTEMKHAYAVADLVVSRAGLSALSEIAALSKPAIIIPIPNSHQEENANEFFKNNAALVINQKNLTPADFAVAIKQVLFDKFESDNLSRNVSKIIPQGAADRIIELIISIK